MFIKWDPTDLLDCLEVEPSVDDDRVEYAYEVVKDGLILLVSVFQFSGEVYFSLLREGAKQTLITLKINQCLKIILKKFKHEEYLEFSPSDQSPDIFDPQNSITKGVRVWIKPDIKLAVYE